MGASGMSNNQEILTLRLSREDLEGLRRIVRDSIVLWHDVETIGSQEELRQNIIDNPIGDLAQYAAFMELRTRIDWAVAGTLLDIPYD